MKRILGLLGSAACLLVCHVQARDALPSQTPVIDSHRATARSLDRPNATLLSAAAAPETTVLAFFDFNHFGLCDPQGWTSVDLTHQADYFHVDDFVGLGGGYGGGLVALEGAQSMWCGARPDANDLELCQYQTLPGYGNNWDQGLRTACLNVTGDVTLDFLIRWDIEPGEEYWHLRVNHCDDPWTSVRRQSSSGFEVGHEVFPDSLHDGQIRIEFRLWTDGAWSDQDGLWNTDGAIIVDSITVTDALGTVLGTELFEPESVGDHATLSGSWTSAPRQGYGDFAAMFQSIAYAQEDPCFSNLTCAWGFFSGSTYNYACGGFPQQPAVPYNEQDENGYATYISNEVWSPIIAIAGTGTSVEVACDIYRDLPLDALVFYQVRVRSVIDGCPTGWRPFNLLRYGDEKAWVHDVFELGTHLDLGAGHMQVGIGVIDGCAWWCGVYGSGLCHSHSPLIDNVEVRRIDTVGPQWANHPTRMFQDAFPGDGTATGTVRADIAADLQWATNPAILPGDSAVVVVADPEVGLAVDPFTGDGPAVYAYVRVTPSGQPTKQGGALSGDPARWPVVQAVVAAGATWYCLRADTVIDRYDRIVADNFCVDLNDNLFTPGDTVHFFFSAVSDNPAGDVTYWSEFTGATTDASRAASNPMEFTCLPAAGQGSGQILYVDNADGSGAQVFFDTALDQLGLLASVDRYDVRGPGTLSSNGPASRVAALGQLTDHYSVILWDAGALGTGSVGDGSGDGSKADDFDLLLSFLDTVPGGGVYLCGDNLASTWDISTATAANTFRTTFMNHSVTNASHTAAGLGVSPLAIGEAGGIFDGVPGPDTLVAYGGCPVLTRFDVLAPESGAVTQASYHGMGGPAGAVLSQVTVNSQAADVAVVLSGFSFSRIRDDRPAGTMDRTRHLQKIIALLAGASPPPPIGVGDSPARSALAQNYPNPFNPTTTMRFQLREPGRATLRVYNVAGQLVRTLVDGIVPGGAAQVVTWDGTSDVGQVVASGVYFYRLTSRSFTQTRKMVLLK